MTPETLRAWWWTRSGLDGSLHGKSAAEVLKRAGWMRSVGGAGPYLGLHARSGLSRPEIDAALAAIEIHELPSARGCTYVLPAAEYALGLRAGQGTTDSGDLAAAKKYLGFTDAELERLCTGVLAALAQGSLDPIALKRALGETVRSFGAEGKKRGQTTSLPIALGWLQAHGKIRRIPVNGRLDQQRYAYTLWDPSPLTGASDALATRAQLASRFLAWSGPATLDQLQAFGGWSKRDTNAAVEPLGLLAVGEDRLLLPGDKAAFDAFVAPTAPNPKFLSSLDNLLLARRDVGALIDAADAGQQLWTEKGLTAGGALSDLSNQAIVDRGRIVGVWDWDGVKGELVWATFSPPTEAIRAEAARMSTWIAENLGDVRTFSLDSPESRVPRLVPIRALAAATRRG
ncbi:hypothetical protein LBMAG42_41900 [Deltaproteobacteria bacterium]|nr:hypothetical protein LBMAG42_41900 [Deltaproteobacteria bacterium]